MEDSGNVFFYAALIVIAFISWVVGKVREGLEAMRERKEYKERPIRTDIGPPTSSSTPPPPPPQITQRDRAKEAMRETYRALGIPFPEDEEAAPAPTPTQPPPRQSRPPAKRTKKVVAAGDQLTAAERSALKRLQQKQKQKVGTGKGSLASVGASNNGDADRFRQLLRNRSAIQQAILLKEILDPPKALQTDSL